MCSEKAMAPHSSTLAWKIPWTEEPGRLQSMGSLRVGHDWATSLSLFSLSCIGEGNAWRIPGTGEPSGLLSMGSHRVRHDWSDLAAAAADSIFKSRDITLPTKVHLVKAMVSPAVTYGCEIWNIKKAAATAKSLQSSPTMCDPIDGSPPGSPVPGILQARVLEWVAISFSNAWKWKVKVKSLSCDPMDWSSPCSSVHGIFQARVLEWVASVLSALQSKGLSRVFSNTTV